MFSIAAFLKQKIFVANKVKGIGILVESNQLYI